MPGDPGVAYHALLLAVRHGRISLAQLDASVARIVSLKLARGLASEPAVAPSAAAGSGHVPAAESGPGTSQPLNYGRG